jgi:hypothetical protein
MEFLCVSFRNDTPEIEESVTSWTACYGFELEMESRISPLWLVKEPERKPKLKQLAFQSNRPKFHVNDTAARVTFTLAYFASR